MTKSLKQVMEEQERKAVDFFKAPEVVKHFRDSICIYCGRPADMTKEMDVLKQFFRQAMLAAAEAMVVGEIEYTDAKVDGKYSEMQAGTEQGYISARRLQLQQLEEAK